jgi:type IV pilus assembly protein PilP
MVGTVRQGGVVWGLLKGADTTIHRVRVGNYLGKNYGKIVSINDNQVEIVEIVADSSGAWHERRAGLELTEVDERN